MGPLFNPDSSSQEQASPLLKGPVTGKQNTLLLVQGRQET